MKERVEKITPLGSQVWVSTFHSTCVRILRRYIDRLGYDTNFTIYDTDDQKSVIKEACKKLNIDTKMLKERTIMSAISRAKDELVTPDEMEINAGNDYNAKRIAGVYREYQKMLKTNNALDFDDLIFKTVELFKQNEDILFAYQERFRYIMVDEYQDTNTVQFKFVSTADCLCIKRCRICRNVKFLSGQGHQTGTFDAQQCRCRKMGKLFFECSALSFGHGFTSDLQCCTFCISHHSGNIQELEKANFLTEKTELFLALYS